MKTPEEKYNEMCESAAQFLRDKKLTEAFEAAKIAFETAMYTAQFASPEERPKWMYRAEKALEIAEGIDEKIKSGQKPGTQQQSVKDGSKDVDLALPSRPKERFADVSGMQEAKDVVRMQVITPIKKPEIAQKYGLQSGGGLLLYGLPGTGKTFFAKAVAGELGLPFYVIKSSDILSKYLGESEKIFQNIFDTARKNPMSVIFIDETNGLLPSRNSESVHEVSKRIADIFLQETDGIDSKEKNPFLLIGATNFPNNIADAALDRFSTCIEVELPDASTRKFILQRELGKMEINIAEASVDFLVEQTQNFSCRALVNLGAYYRNTAAKNEIAKFSLEFCKENFRDTHIVSTNVIENIKDFKTRLGQNAIAEKKSL